MAKKEKKKRVKKTYNGLAALQRRAESILVGKGQLLAFVGGAVMSGVDVVNMERLVSTINGKKQKEDMVVAIQDQLRNRKRKWTIVYGFLIRERDEDGEEFVSPLTDWFYVDHATAGEMDNAATAMLAQERIAHIEKLRADGRKAGDLLGTVYLAIPADVKEDGEHKPDDMMENVDEYLEKKGFFDIEKLEEAHTMNRLKYMAWEDKNKDGEHEAHGSAFMTTM